METNMNEEYKNLLESLEDITGQMQMEKLTFEQVLDTLRSIARYYDEKRGN